MAVNQDIADGILTREIQIARLSAGETRWVLSQLVQLRTELRNSLVEHDPTGVMTRFQEGRVRRLLADVNEAIAETYRVINRREVGVMGNLAVQEGRVIPVIVNEAAQEAIFTKVVDVQELRALARAPIVEGAPASEWWRGQASDLRQGYANIIRDGVRRGLTPRQMNRTVRDLMETSARNAQALVDTSLASVAAEARHMTYLENVDVLRGEQWLTTLDTRACVQCIPLSGLIWDIETHRPIGHRKPWPGPPPLHFRCRCVMVPVVAGESAALDETYNQWFNRQAATRQRDILGPARHELWKQGLLPLRRLTDQGHAVRTLDQIAA